MDTTKKVCKGYKTYKLELFNRMKKENPQMTKEIIDMKAKESWKEMSTDEKRTYKQMEGMNKKTEEGSKRTAFHYFINYYYQEME